MEAGYIRHMSKRLVNSLAGCGITVFVIESVFLASVCWGASCYEDDSGVRMAHHAARAVDALIACMGLCLALAMLVQRSRPFLSCRSLELVGATYCFFFLIFGAFTDDFNMRSLLGATTGYSADAWFLLFIDSVVTISHLVLPLRWSVLWPLEIASMLMFPITSVAFPRLWEFPVAHVLTLTVLLAASSIGKRNLELRER